MTPTLPRIRRVPAAALAVATTPALAHHPMGGAAPDTAWQGLLSGFGHPVIGPDHFAFLIAAGLLLAWANGGDRRRAAGLAIAFAVAGALGTLLRLAAPSLGGAEPLVGASLVVVALGLLAGRMPGTVTTMIVAALAGLVHGHAFGEAVIGAEPTPIFAYLAGLAAVQGMLLGLVYAGGRWLAARRPDRVAASMRAAGVVAAAIGIAAAGGVLMA